MIEGQSISIGIDNISAEKKSFLGSNKQLWETFLPPRKSTKKLNEEKKC